MKRATVASALTKSTPKENSSSMPNPTVVDPDVIAHLRKYHASLMVATTMIKSFHYCITGMGFFTIHPKLGEYWEELDDTIDEVAELIVTMKGVPVLTLDEAIKLSVISEHPFAGKITCKQAMTIVETVFNSLADMSKNIALVFDEMGDVGSSGTIGEHYNFYTKSNWMVRAYLND